ncbi:MAG: hypothetical protein V7K89_32190, partial [Nostoc sp.]
SFSIFSNLRRLTVWTMHSMNPLLIPLLCNTKADTQAGDIIVNATGTVRVGEESRIANVVDTSTLGNAGDIRITASSLFLSDNAKLRTTTFGQGNGGNLLIEAADRVSLDRDAAIFAEVKGTGNGGNIRINTASFSATNGAGLSNSIYGKGNAGDIFINASGRISLDRDTAIFTEIEGTGNGGNIEITTGSLSITGGAQLLTNTVGRGSAGNIIINARDGVSFDGTTRSGRFPSTAFNSVNTESNFTGKGGNITVYTNLFRIIDGATIDARTLNSSDASNITREHPSLAKTSNSKCSVEVSTTNRKY